MFLRSTFKIAFAWFFFLTAALMICFNALDACYTTTVENAIHNQVKFEIVA